eukprot:9500942-Pyramimonas_sp.AAC.1
MRACTAVRRTRAALLAREVAVAHGSPALRNLSAKQERSWALLARRALLDETGSLALSTASLRATPA